jgi:hypothetical protein
MDNLELEKLLVDIQELKRSVRKANPFLREIMAIRAYSKMSLPLGILLLAICLVAHFLVKANGSFEAIPIGWKMLTLAVFALVLVIGSVTKWIIINRRAAQVKDGANYFTVIEAIYGSNLFGISVPFILCAAATSLYFARSGHPWLIVSFIAVFFGPFCNMISMLIDRREYMFTGWYLIATGLASLFFIEATPFIWLAIVWAGTFLVFGAAGLAAGRSERRQGT